MSDKTLRIKYMDNKNMKLEIEQEDLKEFQRINLKLAQVSQWKKEQREELEAEMRIEQQKEWEAEMRAKQQKEWEAEMRAKQQKEWESKIKAEEERNKKK